MSSAAFVITCLSVLCGVGFFVAFYLSLTVLDPSEVEKINQRLPGKGYFTARARQYLFIGEMLTPAIIARHWRTRPQARRTLTLAVVFFSVAALTAFLDALLH